MMKRGKILIVDDNEDILFTLKMLLRPIAESITTLNDPRELLPIISRTRFDVILLDMNFRQDAVSGKEGFHWLGDYEITADELLGGITPKANKKERAKQLIYELAETNNVVKSEDIVNLAEEKGISKRTLENAKKELGIKGKRIGESWYWNLDEIVKA